MKRNKLVIFECILVYISLGLNWGAILVNRTLPLGTGIILSLGWLLIFTKIREFYDNKDIKILSKIKLTHFGALIAFIAYLIVLLRFY